MTARRQSDFARLHCIFYDSNLCHVACLLKVGVMQIVLAMLEAGCVNPALILDDPLEAVGRFSHDPRLQARARMASGKKLTAVELQLLFLEEAEKFCAAGGCDRVVPHAGDILALYADTLQKLHAGDLDALAPRLDWVLKLRILQRAMAQRPRLGWDSPEIKLLDHLYSSLDPDEGLYWLYEKAGVTESIASAAQIERFVYEPPEDTRAYSRAMLLRLAEPDQINSVNWDSIGFRLAGRSGWPVYRTLEMADPLAFTKADTAALFESGEPLETILDALMHEDSAGTHGGDTPRCPKARLRKSSSCCPRRRRCRQVATPPSAIRTSSSNRVNISSTRRRTGRCCYMNVITRVSDAGRQGPPSGGPSNLDQLRQTGESHLQAADQAIDRALGRRFAGVSACNPAGRRAIGVADRLFGLETEYAFSALGPRGARVGQGPALSRFMELARENLPHLPDRGSSGVFLQNGSRLYLDCGGHPELATPELANPWDACRYALAGDRILAMIADRLAARESAVEQVVLTRCNVCYSPASRSTWGSHESYGHRMAPGGVA